MTSEGQELIRCGAYYGQGFTNNEAEAYALKDALECLEYLKARNPALSLPIRVWVDSQLIVKHLLGIYKKPSKARIYEAIEVAKTIKRQVKFVSYRHTRRELNAVPDDMARRALAERAAVVYWDGDIPEGAPPNQLEELYAGAVEEKAGSFLRSAEATYQSRWKEIVDNIPATAKCLGGVGSPSEGCAGMVATATWQPRLRGVPCGICGTTE